MKPPGIKEEARKLIEKLPENSTWDDLMHQIYVRQSIEAEIADNEAGRTKAVETVRKNRSNRCSYCNTWFSTNDVRQEIEMAFTLAKETIVPDNFIVIKAREFEALGIKPRDALHLACALKGEADL